MASGGSDSGSVVLCRPVLVMGTSPVGVTASGGASGGGAGVGVGGANGSSGGCCGLSLKCLCKWKWEYQHRLYSSAFIYFFGCFVLLGSMATLYTWFAFSPFVRSGMKSLGCQEDNEGSWSVGVFYGDSPFTLKSIETVSRFFFFFLF